MPAKISPRAKTLSNSYTMVLSVIGIGVFVSKSGLPTLLN